MSGEMLCQVVAKLQMLLVLQAIIEHHFSDDLYRVIKMPATYLLGISESCLLGLLGGSHEARWSDPRPFVNVIMN